MHKYCAICNTHSFLFYFYREGLGEAYDKNIAFASSLETFGGGHNDPVAVSFGGSVFAWSFQTTSHIIDMFFWIH